MFLFFYFFNQGEDTTPSKNVFIFPYIYIKYNFIAYYYLPVRLSSM